MGFLKITVKIFLVFMCIGLNCSLVHAQKRDFNEKPIHNFIEDVESSINRTIDNIESLDIPLPLPDGLFFKSRFDYSPKDYYFPFKEIKSGYKLDQKKYDLSFVTAYKQDIDLHIYLKFRLKINKF